MSTWDWIFGLAGIFGVGFSIYTYYKTEIVKTVETANNRIQQERLRNIHLFLVAALNASDSIVQNSKRENITSAELGNMARLVRSELYVIAKATESESVLLSQWRFGRMIESQPLFAQEEPSEKSEPNEEQNYSDDREHSES